MKLLLTSAGISNKAIENELKSLIGKEFLKDRYENIINVLFAK